MLKLIAYAKLINDKFFTNSVTTIAIMGNKPRPSCIVVKLLTHSVIVVNSVNHSTISLVQCFIIIIIIY